MVNGDKTEEQVLTATQGCSIGSACAEMQDAKIRWNKTDGVQLYNEMRGKNQRAPERKLLPFRCSACLRDLSNLRHEAAHFLRGLLLHLSCGVGVGSQGESRVVVTEH